MGIAVSLVLIAFGAILTWGVTKEPEGLNLDAVGVILMVVGLVGFLLSLFLWRTWWGPGWFRHTTYVDDGRAYGSRPRRSAYVEEEEDVPARPGPPPGPAP